MRSGGKDFNYFQLNKLDNFVQFKRTLMFCLEDWGLGPLPPLGYATGNKRADIGLTSSRMEVTKT